MSWRCVEAETLTHAASRAGGAASVCMYVRNPIRGDETDIEAYGLRCDCGTEGTFRETGLSQERRALGNVSHERRNGEYAFLLYPNLKSLYK